jgi:hypothetical protein
MKRKTTENYTHNKHPTQNGNTTITTTINYNDLVRNFIAEVPCQDKFYLLFRLVLSFSAYRNNIKAL